MQPWAGVVEGRVVRAGAQAASKDQGSVLREQPRHPANPNAELVGGSWASTLPRSGGLRLERAGVAPLGLPPLCGAGWYILHRELPICWGPSPPAKLPKNSSTSLTCFLWAGGQLRRVFSQIPLSYPSTWLPSPYACPEGTSPTAVGATPPITCSQSDWLPAAL